MFESRIRDNYILAYVTLNLQQSPLHLRQNLINKYIEGQSFKCMLIFATHLHLLHMITNRCMFKAISVNTILRYRNFNFVGILSRII